MNRRPRPRPLPRRAVWRLALPVPRVAAALLQALAWTVLLAAARPVFEALWQAALGGWLQTLALPSEGGDGMPGPGALVAYAAAAGSTWWAAARLARAGERWRPAVLLLRLAAAALAVGAAAAALWPQALAGAIEGHARLMLWAFVLLIAAAPWVHALAAGLLQLPPSRQAALSALSVLWLALLAPLLTASHLALLSVLGLPVLPLLHLLLGAPLALLGLVALGAWVVRWPATAGG